MKITKNLHLNNADVRNLCIRNNWYAHGDNDAYQLLLYDLIGKEGLYNPTNEQLYQIAQDICEHSGMVCDYDTIAEVMIQVYSLCIIDFMIVD